MAMHTVSDNIRKLVADLNSALIAEGYLFTAFFEKDNEQFKQIAPELMNEMAIRSFDSMVLSESESESSTTFTLSTYANPLALAHGIASNLLDSSDMVKVVKYAVNTAKNEQLAMEIVDSYVNEDEDEEEEEEEEDIEDEEEDN